MSRGLSVITVCYNAKDALKKTFDSVLKQKCNDIEYLVIDGESTDGSLELINEYRELFLQEGIDFISISEKDQGVYDAMNKGVKLASGRWIEFLNAGDTYVNDGILHVIEEMLKVSDSDVCYGDFLLSYMNGDERYMVIPPIDNLKKEMMIGHESAFIRAEIHKKFLYSQQYRIAADYDLFLRLYLAHHKFEYIPVPVIRFTMDGLSTRQSEKMYKEMQQVRIDNHLIKDNEWNRKLIRRNALRHKVYDEMMPGWTKEAWKLFKAMARK